MQIRNVVSSHCTWKHGRQHPQTYRETYPNSQMETTAIASYCWPHRRYWVSWSVHSTMCHITISWEIRKKNNVKCPHPASQSHDRISTFTIYWKTAMLWWIDDRGVNLVVSWSKCVEMQRWCWWLISWTEATTFQDLHNDVDRKWLDVLVNYNIWLALQDALQKKNQVWNCWSSKPQTIAK